MGYSRPPLPINEPVESYAPGTSRREELKREIRKQKNAPPLEIPLVIGGRRIFDRPKTPVTSPQEKSRILAQAPEATKEDCDQAIQAALKAGPTWARMSQTDRGGIFLKAADLLTEKYRAKINTATILGQSKTCHQAEVDAVCELADFFRFQVHYAYELQARGELISPRGQWNRMETRPLEGFVFAVGPFNFTSISANLACAPALMGNTVLWKPAHPSILATYYIMEILEEAGLPPGVINFLSGPAQLIGETALGNPNLAGIHFTGSTQTFDTLWAQVGSRLPTYRQYPRLVGETGGKDFILAHPSASPHNLITALIRGAYEYQGQKCSAASRAYIPRTLWKTIETELTQTIQSIPMGDPEDFTHFMGAVIDERAFDKIKGYIEKAKSDPRIQILAGGETNSEIGFFIRPTLLLSEDPLSPFMKEEIFGPILTVYVYEDHRWGDILELVDQSTPYGLTGAIFAQDRTVIQAATDQLLYAAGNLYINDKPTGAVVGQQPFGGSRRSGTNDKAGSPVHLTRWINYRTIKENFLDQPTYRYPFMGS
jgi:1-pyrroline-5-carboxylate dehydrogenase